MSDEDLVIQFRPDRIVQIDQDNNAHALDPSGSRYCLAFDILPVQIDETMTWQENKDRNFLSWPCQTCAGNALDEEQISPEE